MRRAGRGSRLSGANAIRLAADAIPFRIPTYGLASRVALCLQRPWAFSLAVKGRKPVYERQFFMRD